ncbi:MAG TPA: parallel beta-helix domain-containing protein [Polyangiaceae bacterium]|jgi:parallel beta-helix repeat protein
MRGVLRFGACVVGLFGVVALAGACSSSPSPASCVGTSSPLCAGSGRCIALAACASESDVSTAFATAEDNDTIAFAAGTYAFDNELALGMANGVTVIGPGSGQVTLDFSNQQAATEGVFAQSVSNLTFQGFTVLDTPQNGFKVLSVTGVTFRDIGVTWTAQDATDGAYGLYPVQSTQVLVDGCTISGAADSGIYVGQSQQIVVQNNTVFGNVSGIEIENSFYADVHDNIAHDNTAGILVFALPGLQQDTGHDVRVYDNQIVNNNTKNFAVNSDIVSIVPAGTGFFVMANKNVEIFGNTITGNQTAAAGIISYATSQQPYMDAAYYEWPSFVWLHDNTYSGNGTEPDARSQVGLLLSTGLGMYPNGGNVPDVMWDGFVDPSLPAGPDPMTICVHEPTASAVCNMNFEDIDMSNPNVSKMDCDATLFACTLPTLPPVTWPGLSP